MKKIVIIIVFVFTAVGSSFAQNCAGSYLGTKTLYQYQPKKYTPVPAGYVPVFINHVGRHGARHLTKEVKKSYAYELLMKADSANALTAKGKQLEQMVLALQKVEQGKTKFISAEGRDELYGIARRMAVNYSSVFKGKVNIDVAVTKEVRTTQSANAFISGLNSRLKDTVRTNFYNDDTDLRFYDLSPAYKRYEDSVSNCSLIQSIKKADDFNVLAASVTGQFFNADLLSGIKQNQKEKFVADVFGFAAIAYSLNAEIKQDGFQQEQLNFTKFFTCDQLEKLGRLESAVENLQKGAGTNNNGIQVRVAVPLLVDFIKAADEFMATGKYNARLRFAHAETTAPFAALLQIAAADKPGLSASAIQNNWNSAEIIPLAANIQWIFYKKAGSKDYLVKVLLNEKEAHVDKLDQKHYPYYKWNEVRKLYVAKLKESGVNLTDNMEEYLLNIR